MPKTAKKVRASSKRRPKRPNVPKATVEPTIDAEVERLMEVVRDSALLFDDRPRADAIALLEALSHRCDDLRDELLTEQAKHGD